MSFGSKEVIEARVAMRGWAERKERGAFQVGEPCEPRWNSRNRPGLWKGE